jgi:dihydroneopterin aldolase
MTVDSSSIFLRGLRFHAFHGVLAQERNVGNDFEVNVRLQVDVTRAMLSDDVTHTVNYAEAYSLIEKQMEEPANLVERVAYLIGRSLLERWPEVTEAWVELTKLNPPMGADCQGAGVAIHLINDKTNM